jgi:hypothetical protein
MILGVTWRQGSDRETGVRGYYPGDRAHGRVSAHQWGILIDSLSEGTRP